MDGLHLLSLGEKTPKSILQSNEEMAKRVKENITNENESTEITDDFFFKD